MARSTAGRLVWADLDVDVFPEPIAICEVLAAAPQVAELEHLIAARD
jgi:hypothetical protein